MKLRDCKDYGKPKEYWYIDSSCTGGIDKSEIFNCEHCEKIDDFNKSIGNYFLNKKEAERAVKKLKAWKRLRDKKFHFLGWNSTYKGDNVDFYLDWIDSDSTEDLVKDLDLLFGGEE